MTVDEPGYYSIGNVGVVGMGSSRSLYRRSICRWPLKMLISCAKDDLRRILEVSLTLVHDFDALALALSGPSFLPQTRSPRISRILKVELAFLRMMKPAHIHSLNTLHIGPYYSRSLPV